MASSEHRQRIRPDLVGRVAVGGDAIRPDEHDVDLAEAHEMAGRNIRDERVRYPGLGELPGRETGALEVRPALVDPDPDVPLCVVGRLDDPKGRPELAAGERSGVAMSEDPERPELLHGQGGQAEFGEPPVVGGGLADDGVRLGAERDGDDATVVDEVTDGLEAGHHAIDRPAEVDRGRTGRAERCRSCPGDCPASEGQGLLGSLGR